MSPLMDLVHDKIFLGVDRVENGSVYLYQLVGPM